MCSEKKIKNECCSGHDNEFEHDARDNRVDGEDVDGQEEMDEEIEDCCQELLDMQDKYTHVLADMQNFRQRVDKERVQWSAMAQAEVIKKVLPIVDNFDRALEESSKGEAENNPSIAGFVMIHKSLLKMLASLGVEPMTNFTVFDPEKHEAIMQVDAPGFASGDIVTVLEKGYMFRNEPLRPAKVAVAK